MRKRHNLFRHAALLTIALASVSAVSAHAEQVTLDDGTTCTVIESSSATGNGTSSSVTAGGGTVSSSTTMGGATTSTTSSAGSSSSSASSSSSGGSDGQSISIATATRPDGSIITRRSDGTCDISKPTK